MIQTGIYRHFKGGTVFVYGTAESSENDEVLVLYIGMQDKKHHARPYKSFTESVEKDGKTFNRFTLEKPVNFSVDKKIEEDFPQLEV